MRIPAIALMALAGCLGASAAGVPAKPVAGAGTAAPIHLRLKRKRPKTHQATGEVVSVSSTRLTLLHARGRTEQRMAFVLTPQTKKEINVVKGERIIVYYHEDNGHRVAVRIRPARVRHRRSIPVPEKPKH